MHYDVKLLLEIGDLQDQYTKLKSLSPMTKRDIVRLVKPFQEKYHLTDRQALQIARNELSIKEIGLLFADKDAKGE